MILGKWIVVDVWKKNQQMSAQIGNNLLSTSHAVNKGPPNPCFNLGIEDACQSKQ